jgi:hypothetical protein
LVAKHNAMVIPQLTRLTTGSGIYSTTTSYFDPDHCCDRRIRLVALSSIVPFFPSLAIVSIDVSTTANRLRMSSRSLRIVAIQLLELSNNFCMSLGKVSLCSFSMRRITNFVRISRLIVVSRRITKHYYRGQIRTHSAAHCKAIILQSSARLACPGCSSPSSGLGPILQVFGGLSWSSPAAMPLQWLPKEPFSCKEDSSSVVSPSADPGGLQISSDPEDDRDSARCNRLRKLCR